MASAHTRSTSAKVAPKGAAKVAPKGAVKVTPKGAVKVAPKGAVKVAPKGAVKVAPKGAVKVAPKGAIKVAPKKPTKATAPRPKSTQRSTSPPAPRKKVESRKAPRVAKGVAAPKKRMAAVPAVENMPTGRKKAKAPAPLPLAEVSGARGPAHHRSAGQGSAGLVGDAPFVGMERMMELHWGDEPSAPPRVERLVQRWVKRGDALLRHLAEHGAARHEYRADLKEGRFVWLDPEGNVSAEAQAQVLCSYVRSTSVLSMAWADPLVRGAAVSRFDGMPKERDDIDEEGAWKVAMEAAELAKAEYLYRVTTPHAWYFLSLKGLTFAPERRSFIPSTPVGLVLRALVEIRRGIESRAEPTEVVRSRLNGVGKALLHEAEYVYRGTDWVARLSRAGRCLVHLGERLPRVSYSSVAAGRNVEEWLDHTETVELLQSLSLIEDEWALFV